MNWEGQGCGNSGFIFPVAWKRGRVQGVTVMGEDCIKGERVVCV